MVDGVSDEDMEGWQPFEAEDDRDDASVDDDEAMTRLSGEGEFEYLLKAPVLLFLNTVVSSTRLFCCSSKGKVGKGGLGLLLMVLLLL